MDLDEGAASCDLRALVVRSPLISTGDVSSAVMAALEHAAAQVGVTTAVGVRLLESLGSVRDDRRIANHTWTLFEGPLHPSLRGLKIDEAIRAWVLADFLCLDVTPLVEDIVQRYSEAPSVLHDWKAAIGAGGNSAELHLWPACCAMFGTLRAAWNKAWTVQDTSNGPCPIPAAFGLLAPAKWWEQDGVLCAAFTSSVTDIRGLGGPPLRKCALCAAAVAGRSAIVMALVWPDSVLEVAYAAVRGHQAVTLRLLCDAFPAEFMGEAFYGDFLESEDAIPEDVTWLFTHARTIVPPVPVVLESVLSERYTECKLLDDTFLKVLDALVAAQPNVFADAALTQRLVAAVADRETGPIPSVYPLRVLTWIFVHAREAGHAPDFIVTESSVEGLLRRNDLKFVMWLWENGCLATDARIELLESDPELWEEDESNDVEKRVWSCVAGHSRAVLDWLSKHNIFSDHFDIKQAWALAAAEDNVPVLTWLDKNGY